MKILFINAVCGVGSTGRIIVDLVQQSKSMGHTVKVVCSKIEPIKGVEPNEVIQIGSKMDYYVHNALSRLTDHEGLYSKNATKKLIKQIGDFNPDIIHLHNLHGHWINYELLFQYLSINDKKVIWTLHDCWAFTGHCSHFSLLGCNQWKEHCRNCNGLRVYPMCYGEGDVSNNYSRKRKAFTSIKRMTIVTPSNWLASLVKQSFLHEYPVQIVHNKIDLNVFKPTESGFRERYHLNNKIIVLGVANVWNREKGFEDFLRLTELLDEEYAFVMVGLTQDQLDLLPSRIVGIKRTHNTKELAEIYSAADVFVNLTYQDNFPTVNLEAIACGTPVISYKTGGSCEAFDEKSGIAINQGAIESVANVIKNGLKIERSDVIAHSFEYKTYGDYRLFYGDK